MGHTALWASQQFGKVVTIENSQEIYAATSKRLSHVKNIDFIYGHTLAKLEEIVPGLRAPAIFWLDAHWSGGATYGSGDECPILGELEIINRSELPHCILIDDARLFTAPPPPPHSAKQWPNITELLATINSNPGRYIVIVDDVVVSVPESARQLVEQYCIHQGSMSPAAQMQAGFKMIAGGLRSAIRSRS